MISLSNSTAVALPVGQSLVFDVVNFHTGCAECHMRNSSSVKLKASGIYEVSFHANVSSPAAGTALSVSVALGGTAVNGGTMITTPAAADTFDSISITVPIRNCCCDFDRVTITNTGSTGITVDAGALLYIRRLS